MDKIKGKIKFGGSIESDAYRKIFEAAGTSAVARCEESSEFCINTSRAKASAFVYLVKLNDTRNSLSITDREGHRNTALAYLRYVKIQGLNKIYDYIDYIPLEPRTYIVVNKIINPDCSWFTMATNDLESKGIRNALSNLGYATLVL